MYICRCIYIYMYVHKSIYKRLYLELQPPNSLKPEEKTSMFAAFPFWVAPDSICHPLQLRAPHSNAHAVAKESPPPKCWRCQGSPPMIFVQISWFWSVKIWRICFLFSSKDLFHWLKEVLFQFSMHTNIHGIEIRYGIGQILNGKTF